jgi:hypothetical protein
MREWERTADAKRMEFWKGKSYWKGRREGGKGARKEGGGREASKRLYAFTPW